MVRNTLYGIATAKSLGKSNPTVGIANVEGARQVEKILLDLKENGYEFEFETSQRADGGSVMRGNDLLMGTPDVMVVDSLTGNLFMKVFSAFTTGGDYEASGFGYGPGVGEDYDRRILILSRASGSPVVANALKYAYEVAKGKVNEIARKEFEKANKAKLDEFISKLKVKKEGSATTEEVKMPEKEVVTAQISGIDIPLLYTSISLNVFPVISFIILFILYSAVLCFLFPLIKYSYSANFAISRGLWKNLNIVKSPLLYKNNYNIFYREYKNSISSHVVRKYRILLNIIHWIWIT